MYTESGILVDSRKILLIIINIIKKTYFGWLNKTPPPFFFPRVVFVFRETPKPYIFIGFSYISILFFLMGS